MSKKSLFIIIGALVGAVVLGFTAYFLGTRESNKVVVSSSGNSDSSESKKSSSNEIVLATVLKTLQEKFPTVESGYEFTEQRDPNLNLGKTGYYLAGFNFYDTRTGDKPVDEAFGVDAGGGIEIYDTEALARKRLEYLIGFQGDPMLDPGAVQQSGKIIIRASSKLSKTQQDELTGFLSSQVQ